MTPPGTGYSLESMHTTLASYHSLLADDLPDERDLGFRWDWRFIGERRFEVLLGATVGASKETPDEMEAVVVGTFEVIGEVQSIEMRKFVSLNAPALLMPYVRQAITNLSAHGPHGHFFLPPINVVVLSQSFDHEAATGFPQLTDGTTLIEPPEDAVEIE